MKHILNSIISSYLRTQYSRIEHIRCFAVKDQEDIFQNLIACGKDTVFGIEHHFSNIKNYEDFIKQTPLRTYEELFPYIEKCLKGEKNVLWNTPIHHFSKSSGTTNAQSKYIPISQQSLFQDHIQAARDLVVNYLSLYPKSKLFTGKALRLGGSLSPSTTTKGIVTGDLSAILMTNTPSWVDIYSTPKCSTAVIADWNEKLPKMIAEVTKADVTSLSGVPSWMLVMLQKALEETGKENLLEIWPHLELFMHGGISFSPYQQIYKKLIPSDQMHYYEVYNASEGFFAFQDTKESKDMLLMTNHGIFYEFIPMNVFGTEHQHIVPLCDVKKDVNYAMVISTNGGLWRYIIGDTVRFTSVKPYRIVITGRTKQYINTFGEELMVENADRALRKACEATSATINEYTAAPVYMDSKTSGAHEWMIEFSTPPTSIEAFTHMLDETLKELNSDYRAKRYCDVTLRTPIIHVVEKGLFFNWMEKRGKIGGQNKVPRLSNDRTYIEALLEMIK
ncbi:MAG: GH3 auxin-responsive promoter family protein [Flavobacteriales bacterium]|nr:GH3 auxin-responsive promoter family protein [Flavobacteriales bacterium]